MAASGDIVPKGYKTGQLQQFTPEQIQRLQQMFGNTGEGSYLSKLAGGDEDLFAQMEAPAWRDLQQAQGQMASRFSGQGMGGRHGSAFQNAGSQLSSDFAMNLQSQRQNLQRQAIKDLHGMSNDLLNQRPYERFMYEKPDRQEMWKQLVSVGLPIAGEAAGAYFGAPPGTGSTVGKAGANAITSNSGGGTTQTRTFSGGGGGISSSSNPNLLF